MSNLNRRVIHLPQNGIVLRNWSCKACTFSNLPSNGRCAACDTPKPQDVPLAPRKVSTEFWECPNCTLHNRMINKRCDVCKFEREPKQSSAVSASSQDDKSWACQRCTYENSWRAETCEICEGIRPKRVSKVGPTPSLNRTNTLSNKNSITERTYDNIVEYCSKTGYQFVDDSFPPIPKSLYFQNSKTAKTDSVTQWLRPNDIATERGNGSQEWEVFRSPLASDITQGVLGNCWFLSALAVVAERKELIEKILLTRKISSVGTYMVKLCKDGFWTTVIIDDVFPCDKSWRLVYSKAKRNQLWVPLIEKAVAKLHGCYQALVAGRVVEGLVTLTGCPCETVSLHKEADEEVDHDLAWAQLISSHSAGFLMGAMCGGRNVNVDEKEFEEKGLLSSHAYSVLSVDDANGRRLLRLRNPWGRYSWKGDWSDNSSLWTPALRERLMPNGAGEGVFWISFDDLIKYFDGVDVCKVRPTWQDKRLHGKFFKCNEMQRLHGVQLTVTETTEIEISLFQEGNRSRKDPQVDISVVILQCKQSGTNITFERFVARSKRQVGSFVNCQTFLTPGNYIAIPMAFNHWKTGLRTSAPGYVIAFHSAKVVPLKQITMPPATLADAVILTTINQGQRLNSQGAMSVYCLSKDWAGLTIVAENRDSKRWLQVKCDCNGSFNMVSTRSELTTFDAIPPLHRQVVSHLSQLEGREGYSMKYSMVQRISHMKGLQDWAPHGMEHYPAISSDSALLHNPRPI